MKKLLVLLVCSMLIISGCTSTDSDEPNSASLYTAGSYETTTQGYRGEVNVKTTFDDNGITSIEIVSHGDTLGISDEAFKQIPVAIVENQSLAVDTMTGATVSSYAVIGAVAEAITQAGGDAEAWKTKEVVKNVEDITIDTDVVIIGAGAAGLSAAVEASLTGASVLVLEQNSMQGGSTARSGGKLLAADTEYQKNMGIEDSAEAFADYLIEVGENQVSEEKINYIAEQSNDIIVWLEDLGVKFAAELEPLHDTFNPIRGHYTLGGGGKTDGKGGSITNSLKAEAESQGVEFLFHTTANSLIIDNKDVVGVNATKKDGSNVTVNAKSVILATGGYDYNEELFAKYAPKATAGFHTVSPLHTGSGLIMAQEAGAQIVAGGGAITLYLDFFTGQENPHGMYVTEQGQRFMNEYSFWFTRTKELMDVNGKALFWVTDKSTDIYGNYDSLVEEKKVFKGTAEEIAANLGFDSKSFVNEVATYNTYEDNGVDAEFNKPAEYLTALNNEELYVLPFGSVSSGTIGGPLTDLNGQVLNTNNEVINGLYAAGEVANGDLMYQEYPGSGTSITMCIAMGRLTGQNAANTALTK